MWHSLYWWRLTALNAKYLHHSKNNTERKRRKKSSNVQTSKLKPHFHLFIHHTLKLTTISFERIHNILTRNISDTALAAASHYIHLLIIIIIDNTLDKITARIAFKYWQFIGISAIVCGFSIIALFLLPIIIIIDWTTET